MGLVKLEGMEFYAYHGYYDEEQKMGNKYNVDLVVSVNVEEASETDKLQYAVNYEALYRIVKGEMLISSRLLEHVAQRIATKVREKYTKIAWAEVAISKFNPPIAGVCRAATVVYRN